MFSLVASHMLMFHHLLHHLMLSLHTTSHHVLIHGHALVVHVHALSVTVHTHHVTAYGATLYLSTIFVIPMHHLHGLVHHLPMLIHHGLALIRIICLLDTMHHVTHILQIAIHLIHMLVEMMGTHRHVRGSIFSKNLAVWYAHQGHQ